MIAASDDRLGKREYKVLIVLYGHADKHGKCHPKRETLAEMTGLTIRNVSKATANLQSFGWLVKVGNGGRSRPAQYVISVPKTLSKTDTVTNPVQNEHGIDKTPSKTDRVNRKETLSKTGTKTLSKTDRGKEQTNEQIKEKEKKEKEKWKPPHWLNLQAWAEFEQHRREIKKPLSDLARQKAANQLKCLNHEQQQACVDSTIQNHWQGLFPDKHRGNNNATSKPVSAAAERDERHRNLYRQEYEKAIAEECSAEIVGETEDSIRKSMDSSCGWSTGGRGGQNQGLGGSPWQSDAGRTGSGPRCVEQRVSAELSAVQGGLQIQQGQSGEQNTPGITETAARQKKCGWFH